MSLCTFHAQLGEVSFDIESCSIVRPCLEDVGEVCLHLFIRPRVVSNTHASDFEDIVTSTFSREEEVRKI